MGWVLHLKEAGFNVKTTDVPDVTPLKQEKGIPQRLFSCHTGLVDGYVIEGHVPAEDIRRLLDERPDVAGISVPGMPMGSPGMDGAEVPLPGVPGDLVHRRRRAGALQHPHAAIAAAGRSCAPSGEAMVKHRSSRARFLVRIRHGAAWVAAGRARRSRPGRLRPRPAASSSSPVAVS